MKSSSFNSGTELAAQPGTPSAHGNTLSRTFLSRQLDQRSQASDDSGFALFMAVVVVVPVIAIAFTAY